MKGLRDEKKAHLKTNTERRKALTELNEVRSSLKKEYDNVVINYNKFRNDRV